MNAAFEREAQRQQSLLAALWRDAPGQAPHVALTSPRGSDATQGLAAYRSNAAAIAERALAGTYPTIAALVGEETFNRLARGLWQRHPPECGDLGEWGGALPVFIADQASLAAEPYLADSARLDWLVHRAARAADDAEAAPALQALAENAPDALHLRLRAGCALLASAWPVAAVWQAHQGHQGQQPTHANIDEISDERFAAVRSAFAAGTRQTAFVWRDGFVVRVEALADDAAAFVGALLRGEALATALDAAGAHFAFDRWLVQALQQRWLVGIQTTTHPTTP